MLAVEQASAEPSGDGWLVRWRIRNTGLAPLIIHSVWLPHGRFRSQEWTLDPLLVVPAGGEATLDSVVAWDGGAVENAFLILRTDAGRVFVRLRVEIGAGPRAAAEGITYG
ncbi:MAG: hypothetical protein ACHQ7M_05915 [Chloroflexota bacterium]